MGGSGSSIEGGLLGAIGPGDWRDAGNPFSPSGGTSRGDSLSESEFVLESLEDLLGDRSSPVLVACRWAAAMADAGVWPRLKKTGVSKSSGLVKRFLYSDKSAAADKEIFMRGCAGRGVIELPLDKHDLWESELGREGPESTEGRLGADSVWG